jgi:hypothetical protein
MTDRIEDAAASVRIDDGTITVATDGEATVDADTPGYAPRSRRETALTLRVAGAEFEASSSSTARTSRRSRTPSTPVRRPRQSHHSDSFVSLVRSAARRSRLATQER